MYIQRVNNQNSPNFGMPVVIKKSAVNKLDAIHNKCIPERVTEDWSHLMYVRHALRKNPIKITVEDNPDYWWGLKATMKNGKETQVFTQSSMHNFNFLYQAGNQANKINEAKQKLDQLKKKPIQ